MTIAPVATVDGAPIPVDPDLVRMRRARTERLQRELERQQLDGLVVTGTNAVAYVTGAVTPGMDSGRASLLRPVAALRSGDAMPHLFTPFPEGAPAEIDPDHLHGPVWPELGTGDLGLFGAAARVAVDELTSLTSGMECSSAALVLMPAKQCKTPDELACIRRAQQINEAAMLHVQPLLEPGVRASELTGTFLRQVFERGASNAIDPIWQVMPTTRAAGPWTVHGDIAFPIANHDRVLREDDVVWVDTGVSFAGYASDFGRTWLVADNPVPTPRQRAQFERWRAIVDATTSACGPGLPAGSLTRAAIRAAGAVETDDRAGVPWIQHFYLAHGVGTDSAEMPLVGTDLGREFDDSLILAPGMVLVLEPIVWDEGAAGYRSEDIIAITDDGWIQLSDYPYDPW